MDPSPGPFQPPKNQITRHSAEADQLLPVVVRIGPKPQKHCSRSENVGLFGTNPVLPVLVLWRKDKYAFDENRSRQVQ